MLFAVDPADGASYDFRG